MRFENRIGLSDGNTACTKVAAGGVRTQGAKIEPMYPADKHLTNFEGDWPILTKV
jgi:hypothetical protein